MTHLSSQFYIVEQVKKIFKNEDFLDWCIKETKLDKIDLEVNKLVIWLIFMSNDKVYKTYNKNFTYFKEEICPKHMITHTYTVLLSDNFHIETETTTGLKELLELGYLSELDNETYLELKDRFPQLEEVS